MGFKKEKSVVRIDKSFSFYSIFNPYTGEYHRSNILKNGIDSGVDPFMASFPHLIDVGIMGHCSHAKTGHCSAGCYQGGGTKVQPNMTLENFKSILKQCTGKVDQFALGGRGDPDMHENFVEILKLCKDYGIVPNFTTSGYGLTREIARECFRCGAIAVSWYRQDYTLNAIQMLLEESVKTNIHYVLSSNTIEEAIQRLEEDDFPNGINAVIFLLHKPVGLGRQEDVLSASDPRFQRFSELMDAENNSCKIGIDSCTTPGVINFCKGVALESIDTCEGGRFSCYIGADMTMVPCSFDTDQKYGVSLRDNTIEQAWNSPAFEGFRNKLSCACKDCKDRVECMGGCPLLPEIVLCGRTERKYAK
jgi:radical SAM protein with 4Fe4S-binding SPASM domain